MFLEVRGKSISLRVYKVIVYNKIDIPLNDAQRKNIHEISKVNKPLYIQGWII